MSASRYARFLVIGVLLCSPGIACAHVGSRFPAALSRQGAVRPSGGRPGISIPLGPHVRGPEAGARGGDGTAGGRLILSIPNPHAGGLAPLPTPSSDFDPLKRRRVALPATAPALPADAAF